MMTVMIIQELKLYFRSYPNIHEVFMMAPDTNKSGFSSALTFLTPITEQKNRKKYL